MVRQLAIWTFFLTSSATPFVTAAQSIDSLKIHYIKYSNAGKVLNDTTATIGNYGDMIWNVPSLIIGKDTLQIEGSLCNCKMYIYQHGNLIEDYVDVGGDSVFKEINQYSYNQKGQMISKTNKTLNLPWITTEYEYDNSGRLKKEMSNSDRYGAYSLEYIYEKENLIMKVTNDNGHLDTLKINPK